MTITIGGSPPSGAQQAEFRSAFSLLRTPFGDAYVGVWEDRPASPTFGYLAYFTDLGHGTVLWKFDGTQWRPSSPVRVVSRNGVFSAPLSTSPQVLWTAQVPDGLFDNQEVLFRLGYGRSSTTNNGAFSAYLSYATDPIGEGVSPCWVTGSATFAATARSVGSESILKFSGSTVLRLGSAIPTANGTGNGSYIGDSGPTVLDPEIAADLDLSSSPLYFVVVSTMAGSSSAAQLGAASLWVLP